MRGVAQRCGSCKTTNSSPKGEILTKVGILSFSDGVDVVQKVRLVLILGGIVVVSFLVLAFILNVVLSSVPVPIGLLLAIVLLVVLVLGVVLLMRGDRRKYRLDARGHSDEGATDQSRF